MAISCERAATMELNAAAAHAMTKIGHQRMGRLPVTNKLRKLLGTLMNGDLAPAVRVRINPES